VSRRVFYLVCVPVMFFGGLYWAGRESSTWSSSRHASSSAANDNDADYYHSHGWLVVGDHGMVSTDGNVPMADSEETFKAYHRAHDAGDTIGQFELAGNVSLVSPGTKVLVVDRDILGEMYKVRIIDIKSDVFGTAGWIPRAWIKLDTSPTTPLIPQTSNAENADDAKQERAKSDLQTSKNSQTLSCTEFSLDSAGAIGPGGSFTDTGCRPLVRRAVAIVQGRVQPTDYLLGLLDRPSGRPYDPSKATSSTTGRWSASNWWKDMPSNNCCLCEDCWTVWCDVVIRNDEQSKAFYADHARVYWKVNMKTQQVEKVNDLNSQFFTSVN
jgi:hypothetical protein